MRLHATIPGSIRVMLPPIIPRSLYIYIYIYI
jgi:hypothetical protein